ncbi:class I adenylate-forming enzyme family protein [Tropicibacter sp. S64]|uniref:class I adenylate-forming enzyme family protein n=1 Tax=Tropicibacter sp. S64 TaxID=3415122 RepID=UPI003C7AD372
MQTDATNFGDAFKAHVLADPAAPLIEREGRVISRGTVMSRAALLADLFRDAGVTRGEPVALICADQPRGVEAMLALWSLGAAPVFFDIRQTAAEIRASAEQVGATRFFTDFKRLAREPDFVLLPDRPDILPDGMLSFDDIEDTPSIHLATSGTTGAAKFRHRSHRDFIALLDTNFTLIGNIHRLNGLTQGSLSFNAVATHWLRLLTYGCTLISMPLFHTLEELDRALMHPELRSVSLAPVLIRDLLKLHDTRDIATLGPAYPQLQRFSTVGGPIAREDLQRAHHLLSPAACNTYSMSRAGAVAMITGKEAEERPGSVGRPLNGIEVWIEDADQNRLPAGETGLIAVQMHWINGQIVRPGDLGRMDEDGFLYVLGRSEQLACRRSVTINLTEIEEVVLAMEGVRDCMAFALPDARDEGDLIALAVETGLPRDTLAREVRRHVSTMKHPDVFWVTETLPRNASGKISLKHLKALAEDKESGFDRF